MYPSVESSASRTQQHVLGLIDAAGQPVRSSLVGVHLLHQRAVGAPDVFRPSPRIKPQDLVRLLLGHRALARRLTAPRTSVSLEVFTPSGRPAVEISFE